MALGRVVETSGTLRWRVEAERLARENDRLVDANDHLAAANGRLVHLNERLAVENGRLAGDNVALRARVGELEGQVGALTEKVATLTKLAFGKKSEKKAPQPDAPPVPPPGGGEPCAGGEEATRRRRGQQPGSPGHGRRDYSHLPSREEVHDVPEADRVCPRCGAPYDRFGAECCEQIDWEVRIVVVKHRRWVYSRTCHCPVPGMIAAPPVAKPIPKGRFTAGFLARLLTEKFVLGRPVHRIAAALAFEGCELAEGTLAGVFAAVSGLLAPLASAFAERGSAAGHAHVDETSWKVFEAVEGKANNRWWLWVFVGCDTTVFRIEKHRDTAVAAAHFGIDVAAAALAGERRLLVSCDFYTVYQCLAGIDGVDPLYCWAHIRRYFIRAGDAHPALAGWTAAWLMRIGALYLAHRAYGLARPGSAEQARAQLQMREALAVMDSVRRAEAADPATPERARRVLATLDHEWDGLARHVELPELPLDNNPAERALRGPVVGRKNYYGSGSVASAELAGRAWTITATAARWQIGPLPYLVDYLGACAAAGGKAPEGAELARFLPWLASGAQLARWRGQSGRDP